tara:strand:- start:153 stop:425 length:273 start_codon:yes stop_codon:yes gene_type:complete
MKLQKGQTIPKLSLPNTKGELFEINNIKGKKSLITFYRFAQCPLCNLRINEFVKRFEEFKDTLNGVAIFNSPLDHLIKTSKKNTMRFLKS